MQGTGTDRRKRIILLAVFATILFLVVLLDQWTKFYFSYYVEDNGSVAIIDGFFYITYVINTGAAWSFLADVSWGQLLFKILTPIALIAFSIIYVYAFKKNYKWMQISLAFIIGGTIGNFIDRLLNSGVVDFISLVFGDYKFPVFNLADTFLVVGVIMLFVHFLFLDENAIFKKKNAKQDLSDNREQ